VHAAHVPTTTTTPTIHSPPALDDFAGMRLVLLDPRVDAIETHVVVDVKVKQGAGFAWCLQGGSGVIQMNRKKKCIARGSHKSDEETKVPICSNENCTRERNGYMLNKCCCE